LKTDPEVSYFRIVLGCYRHGERHWSAQDELRSTGLQDRQICAFGSRTALNDARSANAHARRRIRDLEVHVSSAALFDQLWPAPDGVDGSLTLWMTPSQSDVVWRKLCDDCAFLMVSADSETQQIQSSRIQLKHGPAVVQAFNFAA
jgi:hypothetical protein